MKKLKLLVSSLIAMLAFAIFAVTGIKVFATSYDIGSATVTTTTNSGDTKTWDFKVADAKTLSNGDDVNGVVVYGGWNVSSQSGKTKAAAPSIKKENNGLDFYWKGYILVPVISSNSTGKINIGLTSNNNQRYLQLIDNAGAVSDYAITALTMSFDFDADDVWNIGDNYYVKVMGAIVSTKSDYSTLVTCDEGQETTVTCSSSGEIKMGSVQIVLDDESYGAAATLHTVTYMDGATPLNTDEEAVDGSNISYTPKKYGYDFEGWYTDASLDPQYKVNTSTYTVTGDVTLYANWTAWTNTGIEEYTLSNAAIEKIATGIDGSLSADLLLTPSIYTAMTGVSMTTTSVTLPGASSATQAACFNTNGAVKTTGNGLKFIAPSNGKLILWAGSGSSEERTIKVTDGNNDLDPSSGSVTVPSSYEPHEIEFDINENTTYYIGGNKGVRIYYISFEEAATAVTPTVTAGTVTGVYSENNENKTAVAFIAKIENVTDPKLLTDMSFHLVATYGVAKEADYAVTTCYTALTAFGETNISGYGSSANTYYVYFVVSGITSDYDELQLNVTFNASYDGVALTQTSFETYTYTSSSQA